MLRQMLVFILCFYIVLSKWLSFCLKDLNSDQSERIISIYRSKVDACGRLWFIDTGLIPGTGK